MRPETGSMKFGDDWCGVFIRGDNAGHFSYALREVLDVCERGEGSVDVFTKQTICNLINLLNNSNEQIVDDDIRQFLKDFEECVSG